MAPDAGDPVSYSIGVGCAGAETYYEIKGDKYKRHITACGYAQEEADEQSAPMPMSFGIGQGSTGFGDPFDMLDTIGAPPSTSWKDVKLGLPTSSTGTGDPMSFGTGHSSTGFGDPFGLLDTTEAPPSTSWKDVKLGLPTSSTGTGDPMSFGIGHGSTSLKTLRESPADLFNMRLPKTPWFDE